jgi:hypothetical protein
MYYTKRETVEYLKIYRSFVVLPRFRTQKLNTFTVGERLHTQTSETTYIRMCRC